MQWKEQVAQAYEVKDAATLAQFGITADDQKEAVDKIVEDMKSTVQDATDAAKQAGEDETWSSRRSWFCSAWIIQW